MTDITSLAKCGDLESLRILDKCESYQHESYRLHVLLIAASYGHLEIVKEYIHKVHDRMANMNVMFDAARGGKKNILEYMVHTKGMKRDSVPHAWKKPISYTLIAYDHFDLLKWWAEVSVDSVYTRSNLELAVACCRYAIVSWLLSKCKRNYIRGEFQRYRDISSMDTDKYEDVTAEDQRRTLIVLHMHNIEGFYTFHCKRGACSVCKTNILDEMWEMEIAEHYESFTQWLPKEILEDLSECVHTAYVGGLVSFS